MAEKITKDWDNFWESGYKNIASEIETLIKSDQSLITLGILDELKPGDKILEAGCGLGNWVFIFSRMGFDVYGIDISKISLEVANNYKRNNNLNCKFLFADIRKIPIRDNFFDLIVSYGAVEHFPDTLDALHDFFRVLKHGGACLITTPNPFSFHRLIGRHILNFTKSQKLGYVGYEDAYTPQQLKNMLEKCGFEKTRCGILPRGFGCIFGSFWWGIPIIGRRLYILLEKIAFSIQKGQNTFGGGSFAIGYKEPEKNEE